jgi:hypothetical protein
MLNSIVKELSNPEVSGPPKLGMGFGRSGLRPLACLTPLTTGTLARIQLSEQLLMILSQPPLVKRDAKQFFCASWRPTTCGPQRIATTPCRCSATSTRVVADISCANDSPRLNSPLRAHNICRSQYLASRATRARPKRGRQILPGQRRTQVRTRRLGKFLLCSRQATNR